MAYFARSSRVKMYGIIKKKKTQFLLLAPPGAFMMAWVLSLIKTIFSIKLVPTFSNSGWWISVAGWSLVVDFFYTFYFHHSFSIRLRSGLSAGLVIELIRLSRKKVLTLFASWQDALSSWKMTTSSLNLFSIDGMRKVSKISMYTCALAVEVMIAISPGPLPGVQPPIIKDWGNVIVFFRQSSSWVSLERHQTKFQRHLHDCFSLARCNLAFFLLCYCWFSFGFSVC